MFLMLALTGTVCIRVLSTQVPIGTMYIQTSVRRAALGLMFTQMCQLSVPTGTMYTQTLVRQVPRGMTCIAL